MGKSLELLRKQAYRSGYGQARADVLEAIRDAIAVVGTTDIPNKAVRLSAMAHIKALVNAITKRRMNEKEDSKEEDTEEEPKKGRGDSEGVAFDC